MMLPGVLVHELVDCAVSNANRAAICRLDDDGIVLITEGQNGVDWLSLVVGNVNALKGRFLSGTEGNQCTYNQKRGKCLVHSLESISDGRCPDLLDAAPRPTQFFSIH
jgi:hypothetical protein